MHQELIRSFQSLRSIYSKYNETEMDDIERRLHLSISLQAQLQKDLEGVQRQIKTHRQTESELRLSKETLAKPIRRPAAQPIYTHAALLVARAKIAGLQQKLSDQKVYASQAATKAEKEKDTLKEELSVQRTTLQIELFGRVQVLADQREAAVIEALHNRQLRYEEVEALTLRCRP